MFNASLTAESRGRPHDPVRWVSLLGAAALHFSLLGGCALDARPGDGVISDGLEVTVAPTLVYDAGGPETDADLSQGLCKQLPLFEARVVPQLAKNCALDCHDGTKKKATNDFNLLFLKTDPSIACTLAVYTGLTQGLAKKLDAPMLTSADPGRPDHVHDFKFKTAAEYNLYRDELMVWINAELPQLP
jgi:hypothetical protein